ncbi:MAG TPA: crotonase/enoyl-CoA hydratase family protein [Alphaproteobacteria bacterium]|nr:crotonase/enoyl-CoA hydratase family protein [Alphaproteobacteria bacterium]
MTVRTEKSGPVTTVIIDRPEVRNAVNPETADALLAAFEAFEADDDALVGVLTGTGGAFCAGYDLKVVSSGTVSLSAVKSDGDGPMGPSRRLLTKPVIAGIAGPAVAGGLELALWCDMRVAEVDAVLGVFCRRWGVPLIDGGTVRLPRLIGMSHALDLILTGRPVGAEEALRMGLVNRVVPNGEARAAAEALAAEIARFPQICMRSDRMSAYEAWDLNLEAAFLNELEHGRRALEAEAVAGAARFAGGKGRGGDFEEI